MKFLSVSLIICIVILLTQPCEDALGAVRGSVVGFSDTGHIEQPSEKEPCSKDCSPFCICSCRQVPSADHGTYLAENSEAAASNISDLLVEYKNPATKSFQNPVWQPPKP